MNYFLLKQWIIENREKHPLVDKIIHNPPLFIMQFNNGSRLVYYYRSNTPLLFWETGAAQQQNTPLYWPQLSNAELIDMDISDTDRILTFSLVFKDIYQSILHYNLVFECMPPRGNIILCLQEKGKNMIQDALSKYSYADNPQRQVLPGLPYEPPRTTFRPSGKEIIYPLQVKTGSGQTVACNNVNDYFRTYYQEVILQSDLTRRKVALQSKWKTSLRKLEKKYALQQAELAEAEQMDTWLQYSELIKANLTQISKGDPTLRAVNYYDPALNEISIPLQTDKSPQDNLKAYLKKYHKAKQGQDKILSQLGNTRTEILQVQTILQKLDTEHWQELDIDTGKTAPTLASIKQVENLLHLTINEDWEILIGRKATENDLVTTQIGKPQDWWFHTRIYRGAHVLLRNFHKKEPPASLIELCSGLAAWFSKARNSENVPVDYTQIRYVRKPRRSAPGFVTYTTHKTLFADPLDVSAAREIIRHYARQD